MREALEAGDPDGHAADDVGLWGNPSSVHAVGRRARAAVESARKQVAALVGGDSEEIVFTSGGTEADHLAIRGLAGAAAPSRRQVISTRVEHPAVLGALEALGAAGMEVTFVPVGTEGQLELAALLGALRDDTALVTIAAANHELGNLYPVAELAAAVRARGGLVHSDAVQAAGRVALDAPALGVDALSLSAHKLGGPKGVGAVWFRRGLPLRPLLLGGHQERERRGGTENVLGIIGFGEACRLARERLPERAAHVAALRDRLEEQLLRIPGARRHGDPGARVPGTANLGFAGAAGELVVIGLDLEGVAVSSGAACTSGTMAPSPVLLALGLAPAQAREAVRFSVGPGNTEDEVDRAAALTAAVVARVRAAA
jgi:cysteine desulfurase